MDLRKRLKWLEESIQERQVKMADTSMLSIEELEILEKVLEYTLAREGAMPTGKRPLVADSSGLSADDMIVYRKMAERAECRRLDL